MNVSEFTDISTATDSLISSIQAFKYTAEESMDVVDILNTIGNNYAISTADLATSLTKSSGSLVAANGTLEEAVALTATANTIIQDADVVGTALKTVAMRLRGTDTKIMEEEGLDVDGAVTSKSKLQSKVKALSGVDILTDTGAYKSTYQILSEIADVWEDINDMDQAALLELLAGKRAGSVMSAILQNPDTLKDAFESANEASGSALAENEKYMESIQGHIDQFTNAYQTMWNNMLDSDLIKGIVDLGTGLAKIVDTIGLIPSILAAILTYKTAISLVKAFHLGDLIPYIQLAWQAKNATEMQGLAVDILNIKQALLNSTLVKAQIVREGLTAAEVAGYSTTQLLTLGLKGLVAGFVNLWTAMGPVGWAIIGITAALVAGVAIFDALTVSAKESKEKLEDLNSEINSLTSELDSLNSELKTTQERMEELLSKDSLSFTEQEELNNLKLQNEQLERQIELQEMILKNKKESRLSAAKDVVEGTWDSASYGKEDYQVDIGNGVIKHDNFMSNGMSGKEALEEGIENYINTKQKKDKWYDNYLRVLKGQYKLSDVLYVEEGKSLSEKYSEKYEKYQTRLQEQADGINMVLGEMSDIIVTNDLQYGQSEWSDKYLDEYYAMTLKWQEAQGITDKSDIIRSIFSSTAPEGIQTLKTQLDEIADSDLDNATKQTQAQELIQNALKSTDKDYQRLNTTMGILDMSAEELAEAFIAVSEAPDISTMGGILEVFATGEEFLNKYRQYKDGNKPEKSDEEKQKRDDHVKQKVFGSSQKEAEEKARLEAEVAAKARAETEAEAQKEAEEQAKKDAEAKAKVAEEVRKLEEAKVQNAAEQQKVAEKIQKLEEERANKLAEGQKATEEIKKLEEERAKIESDANTASKNIQTLEEARKNKLAESQKATEEIKRLEEEKIKIESEANTVSENIKKTEEERLNKENEAKQASEKILALEEEMAKKNAALSADIENAQNQAVEDVRNKVAADAEKAKVDAAQAEEEAAKAKEKAAKDEQKEAEKAQKERDKAKKRSDAAKKRLESQTQDVQSGITSKASFADEIMQRPKYLGRLEDDAESYYDLMDDALGCVDYARARAQDLLYQATGDTNAFSTKYIHVNPDYKYGAKTLGYDLYQEWGEDLGLDGSIPLVQSKRGDKINKNYLQAGTLGVWAESDHTSSRHSDLSEMYGTDFRGHAFVIEGVDYSKDKDNPMISWSHDLSDEIQQTLLSDFEKMGQVSHMINPEMAINYKEGKGPVDWMIAEYGDPDLASQYEPNYEPEHTVDFNDTDSIVGKFKNFIGKSESKVLEHMFGISGKERQANIDTTREFLEGKGLGEKAIAAILGNIDQESGFNTDLYNDLTGRRYGGMFQFRGTRLDKLRNTYGKNPTALNQMEYMWWELTEGDYSNVLPQMTEDKSVDELTEIFAREYEQPKYEDSQARKNNARRFYNDGKNNVLAKYWDSAREYILGHGKRGKIGEVALEETVEAPEIPELSTEDIESQAKLDAKAKVEAKHQQETQAIRDEINKLKQIESQSIKDSQALQDKINTQKESEVESVKKSQLIQDQINSQKEIQSQATKDEEALLNEIEKQKEIKTQATKKIQALQDEIGKYKTIQSQSTKDSQGLQEEIDKQKAIESQSTKKIQTLQDELSKQQEIVDAINKEEIKVEKDESIDSTIVVNVEPVVNNPLADWYDSLDEEQKNFVYEISLETDTAKWDLNTWKEEVQKALDGTSDYVKTEAQDFWDDFFTEDENGEMVADNLKIAEALKGADKEIRDEFTKIIEDVENKKIGIDEAFAKWELVGIDKMTENLNTEFESINTELFPDATDEIDGLIDTLGELKAAFESVASTMDIFKSAQEEFNKTGRVSIQTALELMSKTDDWDKILNITDDTITLMAGSEKELMEIQLQSITEQLRKAAELAAYELQVAKEAQAASEAFEAERQSADNLNESEQALTNTQNTANNMTQHRKRGLNSLETQTDNTAQSEIDYANNENAVLSAEGAKAKAIGLVSAMIIGLDAALQAFNDGSKKGNWGAAVKAFYGSYTKAKEEVLGSYDIEGKTQKAEQAKKLYNISQQANTYDTFSKNYKSDSDGGSDGDSALEALQEKYERQIKNLEGQQTYLENEIERAEALNQGASVDYYKEQISLEDQKLDLLERERKELLALEMNDEVADALWEVEHAIQESTLAAIEFGKAMHEAQIEAIDGISEAYDAMDTISDNRKENLELYKENLEINGKYASEGWYNEMLRLTEEDIARGDQRLQDISNAITEARKMKNPFDEGTEEYDGWQAYMDKNLVEWQAEAAEIKNNQRTLINERDQLKEDMKDNYIAAWDDIIKAFDDIDAHYQNQLGFIDAYEERLNTLNINVPDSVYEEKIDTQNNVISNLDKQLAEGYRLLDDYEARYGKSDQRYTDKLKELEELESTRYQEETKLLEFEQQIFDNQIDRFNQVVDRINNATQRLQNLSDLLADEDVATEDGEWTDEGLTRLGTTYQQMAYYKQSSEEIAEQMEEVEKAYKRGEISEKKYYETMQELSNQQWDAINGYEEMKDAIVELNEARIDMIEEGLDKEIEAYQELIDLKKEELDAERDLYDFKKDVEKQTKDIAALERRIASMSGSTDASTIAERTKLEQQLREAKEGLNDSYYGHAMDSMSNALDDELDAYTKGAEDYIESLRESIKDTDLLIEQTYQKVLQNTDIVLQTITQKADEYGFYIDDYLTSPWENAQTEALDLEASAISHIDNIYDKVNSVTSTMTANITQPWKDGKKDLLSFSEEVPKQLDLMLQKATTNQQEMLDTTTSFVGEMKYQIDLIPTYADEAAQRMLDTAKKNVEQINAEYAKITYPSYEGKPAGGGDTGGNGGYVAKPASDPNAINRTTANITSLQMFLNEGFGVGLSKNGSYDSATKSAVKKVQGIVGANQDAGWYGTNTRDKIIAYWDKKAKGDRQNREWWDRWKPKLPPAMYAKGTLGTTKDQFAITDESWIGEEITLAAGKNGQLQYLKKGSAVMPADISANLVEWGKLNPNMMNIGDMSGGVQLMSNYVSKPELNLSFDSLVHVDHCDEGTLKDLEKMVDTKINQFSKQMNYAIKKFK